MTTVPEYIERAHATLTDAMQQALADEAIREALTAERAAQDAELRDLRAYSEAQAGQIAALEQTVTEQAARIAALEGGGEPPAPEPRHLWEVLVDGLRVRSSPDTSSLANVTARLNRGDVVEGLSVEGDWLHHTEGWSAIRSGASVYLQRRDDVVIPPADPADPKDDPGNLIPPLGEPWLGHVENLVGVDGPADNAEWPWLLPLDNTPGVASLWERIAPFRALKIHQPGTPHWVIDRLQAMRRPGGEQQFHFLPVRIRHDYHTPLSAHDYARQVAMPILDEFALRRQMEDALGPPLLYYTFWNEQNARPHDAPEGLGVAWNNIHEFVDYAIEVLEFVRMGWPDVYVLLPAPSPGYGVAEYNLWRDTMLRDIPSELYDGMEGHYYWDGPATLAGEARRAAQDAAAVGRGKLFVVGECANVIDGVSKAEKGRQLVQFVRAVMAEDVPNFVGAFAFTLFTSATAWKDREVDPEFSEGVRLELEIEVAKETE